MGLLGLCDESTVEGGFVVRQEKAYPIYDDAYAANVLAIRSELEVLHPNLHLVGRNGMHRYNNQDHAMMTAMLTVRNILAGRRAYDVWNVNEDAEYHEEGATGALGSIYESLSDSELAALGSLRPVPQRKRAA